MTERLSALREILRSGSLSTQDELREKLEKLDFAVTQSTVSRDLRKLGAIRATDSVGRVVYKLPTDDSNFTTGADIARNMVKNVQLASTIVVIHTAPGTASLVARHLDMHRPGGVVGTIAGDDTVFLALQSSKSETKALEAIKASLAGLG